MSLSAIRENRNFTSLLAANTILGAAMPILIILGGLSGLMLAPTTAFATLPASLQTLAGLVAAAPFSILMGRVGRRGGFMVGAGCAVVGGLLGVWALIAGSFAMLCVAHFVLGAGLASYQFFRFAAAETVSKDWQPVAISLMLMSGLLAAIGGPQLFILAKDALAPVPLAGAYLAIALISLVGALPLLLVRLPVARVAVRQKGALGARGAAILRQRALRRPIIIGAVSQGIMVFLMVPTPLAMIGCGFTEATAGDVIRWHVVAMFAPSFFTGFLIKRFGTEAIARLGLMLLFLAAVVSASGVTSGHFYGALILLGVGWNFGFIGATNMLSAAVSDSEKSLVQGVNDTMIALVSTVCAFASGALVAGSGWTMLSVLAAGLVFCVLGWAVSGRRTA